MKHDRFDLEQQILKCWDITQDLYTLAERYEHDDELSNFILGIKNVYELRHDKLWEIFEEVVVAKDRKFEIGEVTEDFFDEKRADVVGSNGNEGLHYDSDNS